MSLAFEEELARNDSLRATLTALKQPAVSGGAVKSESQKKAEQKLKIIEMQKKSFDLQQLIEQKEMQAKHLLSEAKELSMKKKDIDTEADQLRNAGKPVWETVGFQTVPYKDPFHTGLMKRTPTGARA